MISNDSGVLELYGNEPLEVPNLNEALVPVIDWLLPIAIVDSVAL